MQLSEINFYNKVVLVKLYFIHNIYQIACLELDLFIKYYKKNF